MTDAEHVSEPQGAKLVRTIAEAVGEQRTASGEHETARRLRSMATIARTMHAALRPAVQSMASELLASMPDEHPMRPMVELLNRQVQE